MIAGARYSHTNLIAWNCDDGPTLEIYSYYVTDPEGNIVELQSWDSKERKSA